VRRLLLVVAAVFVVAVPAASASLMLGVLGSAGRFSSLTGQRSTVGHVIVGWNQGYTWGAPLAKQFSTHGPVPLFAFTMSRIRPSVHEVITPRGVAFGAGDGYLTALNRAIGAWGRVIFIRPFPEMNGHWNSYCAYTSSGRRKDASHSTAMFRKAFARVYLLLHGGSAQQLNTRLRALGLSGVSHDFDNNPYPTLRVVWNPQGYGSPNLPGNTAQAYYPGDRYVDVVANDLYDIGGKAAWAANDRLYKAHRSKPYAIAEWGLWGLDDPAFVRRMAGWARTHYRLQLLAYYAGRSGGVFDLATKPRSRAAYRRYITPLG
jgi:hypothetical protein